MISRLALFLVVLLLFFGLFGWMTIGLFWRLEALALGFVAGFITASVLLLNRR